MHQRGKKERRKLHVAQKKGRISLYLCTQKGKGKKREIPNRKEEIRLKERNSLMPDFFVHAIMQLET